MAHGDAVIGIDVVRQPDGRYAVWDMWLSEFVLINASAEDIIDYYTQWETRNIRRIVTEKVANLEGDRPEWKKLPKSFDDCLAQLVERRGEDCRDQFLKTFSLASGFTKRPMRECK